MVESKEQLLFNTLSELHKTTPLSMISVSQLTRQAGVSRMYFYRHYQTYDDIIRSHILYLFNRFLRLVKKYHANDSQDTCTMFFKVIQTDAQSLGIFIVNGELNLVQSTFERCFTELLIQRVITPALPDSYATAFTIGGLTRLLIVWIQEPNPDSPERMGQVVANLVHTSNYEQV
ncbi:TetR/AcrR family transcriptional regulator [Companilactobacillus jidongensis]|uniref:TetR/AcrR family transcriptional regulator n=1 Tax=Companilactobacillus jidongensis TaxID=2486006 RepID=UPI000F797B10|nr:TetR/AcrR family transcriptional regulator [Companilactobacillus jidongensis]